DETTTKRFNRLVHPPLLTELKRRCDYELEDVVLEAALLFEWGDRIKYDISVCVSAPEHIRRGRTAGLYMEKGFSDRQITQLSPSRKMEMADIVLDNDGSIVELGNKINRLVECFDEYKASGTIQTKLTL
ncbi:MAG: dephospho-CoA kinase, partial [bacterium]|nr:dephospho-CoA kinase [bacterium]